MKIKEIKIVNQDESTEVADIGANAINVDYNDTTVKAELDRLNNVDNSLVSTQNNQQTYLANLQTQINGLASGSPLVASSISEMTDTTHVYVNTTDGKWYYYNGTTWTAGGTYQAAEDSNTIQLMSQTIDDIYDNYLEEDICINQFNSNNLTTGYIAPNSSEIRVSGDYKVTDYIQTNYKKYITSSINGEPVNMRFIAQYDVNKNFISKEIDENTQNTSVCELDKDTFYVRVTPLISSLSENYQIEINDEIVYNDYEPYYPTKHYFNNNAIKESDIARNSKLLNNGLVVSSKDSTTALNMQASFELNDMCDYLIKFSCNLGTDIGTITIGIGNDNDYGGSVTITNTEIICGHRRVNHGLHLVLGMYVVIYAKTDNTADIELISAYNNNNDYTNYYFKWENVPFSARKGVLYAISENTTSSKHKLTLINKKYDCENWLFGDSYFNTIATNRWTYYLVNNHYNNSMLNGFPGRTSSQALNALINLLKIRTPKRVIWCLGMNDGDNADSINTSYQNTVNSLINLSKKYNFDLILSTIPNTPVVNNYYKNEFVRNSNYRYIDFSSCVGANQPNSTWYSNTLSDDNVHPTEKGAVLLYGQALMDVPELY